MRQQSSQLAPQVEPEASAASNGPERRQRLCLPHTELHSRSERATLLRRSGALDHDPTLSRMTAPGLE